MTQARFLLDTNVISEMARPRPHPGVVAFFATAPLCFVSVIVMHELRFGCETAVDPTRRGRLTSFVADVQRRFESSAFPVTLEIAESAAVLRSGEKHCGRVLVPTDALIAATSLVHGLTLATRNAKDFAHLGVPIVDPFEPA